jgi:hypothetical protein
LFVASIRNGRARRVEPGRRPRAAQLGVELVMAEPDAAVGGFRHVRGELGIGDGPRERAKDAEPAPETRQEHELLAVFEIPAVDPALARGIAGPEEGVTEILRIIGVARLLGGDRHAGRAHVFHEKSVARNTDRSRRLEIILQAGEVFVRGLGLQIGIGDLDGLVRVVDRDDTGEVAVIRPANRLARGDLEVEVSRDRVFGAATEERVGVAAVVAFALAVAILILKSGA